MIISVTDLDVGEREGGDGARETADQDGTSRMDEHVGARADRHATGQGRSLDVSLWKQRSVQVQGVDLLCPLGATQVRMKAQHCERSPFNKIFYKIAILGTPQMAADKEDTSLSRDYSYYAKCNLPLF